MNPRAQLYAEIYDEFAPDFERTRVPRFRPFVKKLLQLFDTRPKSSVLDAGTGTGLAATLVAPRVGHEGRVIGIDVSEKQLEIARRKAMSFGFTQCEFRLGDIYGLEFPDGAFDLVLCSFALRGDPDRLFSEFRRVLKPATGVLLCQDWANARTPAEEAYDGLLLRHRVASPGQRLARLRAAKEQDDPDSKSNAPSEEYERLLNEAGFLKVQEHSECIAQHFESAKAYIEWRALETVIKAELEAMEADIREQFTQAAWKAIQPLENEKGLDIDWTAIQLVART